MSLLVLTRVVTCVVVVVCNVAVDGVDGVVVVVIYGGLVIGVVGVGVWLWY